MLVTTGQDKDQEQQEIFYVSGPCGSGKTYALGQYIKEASVNRKFIIAVPSKVLADQTEIQLNLQGLTNVCKVYSDECEKSPVSSVIQTAIEQVNELGHGVIICTQEGFRRVKFIENRDEWVLIIDEIPTVNEFYAPCLPYWHIVLTRCMEISEPVGTILMKVDPTDAFLGPNHDDVQDQIRGLIEDVRSKHHNCYTTTANWQKIVEKRQVTDDAKCSTIWGNQQNKLYFLSMLQPTIYAGFATVIMMGANFESSLLYRYWSEHCNVKFKPLNKILNRLRYTKYDCGQRLTLLYMQDENWSKYSGLKESGGKTWLDHHHTTVERYFENEKFLFVKNKSDKRVFRNGEVIPVVSHGLNDYQHYDRIYFSPALNYEPKHYEMLDALGISKESVKSGLSPEVAHQAIMRTSLRDPNATSDVTAIVVDKDTAEAIAAMFISCKIGRIGGKPRKVIGLDPSDRQQKSRLSNLIELHDLNSLVRPTPSDNENMQKMSQNLYVYRECDKICKNQDPSFNDMEMGITLMSDIYSKGIATQKFNGPMDFTGFMKSIFTNDVISEKNESVLFNGVQYKDNASRSLDNVSHAEFVVLDIDDGDLSPEEFKKIFSKNRNHKYSFFMCNSFSRSEERPNNYRAVFFTKQVVNDHQYRMVHAHLHRIIEDHGYITCRKADIAKHLKQNPNAKFSGIDLTKNHTASFFYISCKIKEREDQAFFWKVNMRDAAQVAKCSIDVEAVIRHTPDDYQKPALIYEAASPRPSAVASFTKEDITKIINEGDFRHLGSHDDYLGMASSMRDFGFTETEFVSLASRLSKSKTPAQAQKYWRDGAKLNKIKAGTMFHHLGLSKGVGTGSTT